MVDQGGLCRLGWLADVLPHTMADAVRERVERAIIEIKRVLESTEIDRRAGDA